MAFLFVGVFAMFLRDICIEIANALCYYKCEKLYLGGFFYEKSTSDFANTYLNL
jgi:hypothetical protein